MKPVYIRWKDACFSKDSFEIDRLGALSELHEIGFLKAETDESYVIGMEHEDGETECRLWLTIPKVNVTEYRQFEIPKASRKRRNAKK